jgi:hypothetical protein
MKTRPSLRKTYNMRLAVRICLLLLSIVMYFSYPQSFAVLTGFNFFHQFSWLHLLWLIWVMDMIMQLTPLKGYLALGSLKHFKSFYQPLKESIDTKKLISFAKRSQLDALKVFLVWSMIVAGIGLVWAAGLLKEKELLLLAVVFYVCDLICVLFWCPFRAWILKNRCCTTCRIFNWDHLMMFSPLFFAPGFYTGSLLIMAAAVFLMWEASFILHPQRFWEKTNAALQCRNCTDKLCAKF